MLWFAKIMVRFFMAIDSTLFSFIATLYDLLIAISRTSILSQGDIAQFAGRIELLLGIFMLFKLSFSLITYVVNPDDFSDKSKGFGKLIQNAVISLAMLVLVPYAFQMAFNLQSKILDDNLLAKLLLGDKLTDVDSDGNETNATIMDSAGHTMAFQVMLPFFSPRVSLSSLNECIRLYDEDGFNDSCYDALSDAGLEPPAIDNYTKGIENNSLGLTFRANTALVETEEDGEKYFIIDYKYPIATVVAVVVCLLLITFCIDIGVRSVKLAFLQLVYTIPVISYMDPKSGKDGLFKKWYQMCFSTFISLFIRLLALYFGIYIIIRVGDFGMYDVVNGSEITNGWVKLFVIIGVLMFIKQLPKLLENLGFKLDGGFSLNPLKKLEDGMIGGKQIIGTGKKIGQKAGKVAAFTAGAGALAFGSNLLSAGSRIKNAQGVRGKLRAGLNTFTGGLSAMRRGVSNGLRNEKLGKGFSNSYSGAMESMRRKQTRADSGVGGLRTGITRAQKKFGLSTLNDKAEQLKNYRKEIESNYDAIKKQANATDKGKIINVNGVDYEGAKGLSKGLEELKNTQIDRSKYNDNNEFLKAVEERRELINNMEDELDKRYNELSLSEDDKDRVYRNLRKNMESTAKKANKLAAQFGMGEEGKEYIEVDGKTIKDINGKSKSIDAELMANSKAGKGAAAEEYLKKNN